MNDDNEEIGDIQSIMLISTAVFFDICQALADFIPFAGWIAGVFVNIFAFLTFYVWLKMLGMSFVNPKRAGIMGGGFLIEMIPIVNALPAWTFAVVTLIGTTKAKRIIGKIPGGSSVIKINEEVK
ncbi:MAG: hypothetical protein ABL899_01270 [Nitrospira sp.]